MPNSMPPMIVAPERDVPAADLQCVGPAHRVDVVDAHGLRPRPLPPFGPQDHERADDEGACHRNGREQHRLDRLVESQPQHGRRQERDEEIANEAVGAGVAPQPADHAQQSHAEFPAHGQYRAGLDDDFEDLRLLARVAQQRTGDDQVSGRGHRQEFGNAFDQAQQQRDDQGGVFQGGSPGGSCARHGG